MRADVDRTEGTGHAAAVPGMVISGKTGTAQVEKDGHIDKSLQVTWFGSFASMGPNEPPIYAVVAMVAGGASGGRTCAPIAHDVYVALQQMERKAAAKPQTLAAVNDFETINNERQWTIDLPQLIAVLCLMLLSVAFVYSATMMNETAIRQLLSPHLFQAIHLVRARPRRGRRRLHGGLPRYLPLVFRRLTGC